MIDPFESKTIGYHLFYEPEGELAAQLQNEITKLSETFGGPEFNPHVTALACIPSGAEDVVIGKTKEFVKQITPFTISFSEVQTENRYFRALYLKAVDSPELQSVHKKALEMFGVEEHGVYVPHLSLFYGNVSDVVKQEMKRSLSLPKPIEFSVNKTHLYRTEGEAENWVKMGSFNFLD